MLKRCTVCYATLCAILVSNVAWSQTEAVLGETFGIGCIVVPISPDEISGARGLEDVQIYEQNNRVLYPVFEVREVAREVTQTFQNARRPIGRLVGEILDQTGTSIAVYFLFTGDQTPLNVSIVTNRTIQKTIVPVQRPVRYRQLIGEWWAKYNTDKKSIVQANDYPPVVREYLRTMLSYRLGLQRPEVKPPIWDKLFYTELGFQLDPTAALFETQADRFFTPEVFSQPAMYDLPPALGDLIMQQYGAPATPLYRPVAFAAPQENEQQPKTSENDDKQQDGEKTSIWGTLTQAFSKATGQLAAPIDGVTPGTDAQSQYEREGVEPIAFHVPAHCFYIRFGSYSNFAWFQDTTALWGGDMRNLVALRALNTRSGERLEQQIGLRQDALAKLFGDSVINDVAVIGTDLFFEEGASFGLLFKARNSSLLSNDFNSKRKELLQKYKSQKAAEQMIDMHGQKVSCISTPDQRIRTFYIAMGDYHLVTRSEQLARDFVVLHTPPDDSQSQQGQVIKPLSLGELPEFQQVRQIKPVERKTTIFLYFSRPYFYNIASPGYWVETQRRTTAAADIELFRLGGMAAAAEGHGSFADVDRWAQLLRDYGYVPPNFGSLPDGSETVLNSWTDIYSTRRGYRGSFVPIADMPATKITEAEYHDYEAMCRKFFDYWGNLDPVVVAIERTPGQSPEGKTEHIVIDARMAPLSQKNAQTLQSKLGQAQVHRMTPIDGNFATFEASLAENFFFGALRNDVPPPVPGEQARPLERIVSGIVLKDQQMLISDLFAGYLGIVGKPGPLLKALDITFLRRDDAYGYSQGIAGTWRRHYDQYTLYSRQRAVLDLIAPQLGFMPAEFAAHARLNIGNPLESRIAPVLNSLGYTRTCDTTRGNLRLLNDLQMQFHINGQECKNVAEQLLGAELVCPLGGQYVYQPYGDPTYGMGRWHATALENVQNASPISAQVPAGFLAPPLNWFRGGKFDTLVSPDAVLLHAELDMLLPK